MYLRLAAVTDEQYKPIRQPWLIHLHQLGQVDSPTNGASLIDVICIVNVGSKQEGFP